MEKSLHVYLSGNYYETALQTKLYHKDVAGSAFLDIQEAYDNATFKEMKLATEKHGFGNTTSKCKIKTKLFFETQMISH